MLLHGSKPIDGAARTLNSLTARSIEFLLLTNGGGLSEARRVAELSRLLGVPLSTHQFVQSHTPFRLHAPSPPSPSSPGSGSRRSTSSSGMRTVLVVGGTGDNCRRVAEEYGFADVLIPADVLASYPGVSPCSDPSHHAPHARPLSTPKKVDAVLVFNDPRDWVTACAPPLAYDDGLTLCRRWTYS